MTALIVEDEPLAARALERTLGDNFPDIEVLAKTGSVEQTVSWLSDPSHSVDLIFMDVELSDGKCFEIFRRIEVHAQVVMTTAYDSYAIKAFEVNSIDYLLKPVELSALRRAVEKCRKASSRSDISQILSAMASPRSYKERFLVYLGDKIVPIKTDSIAFFYSQDKGNYVATTDGAQYVIDQSLDSVFEQLDKSKFFKISRSCIISKHIVGSVSKLLGGRLEVNVQPSVLISKSSTAELSVSRSRVDDFLDWLGR